MAQAHVVYMSSNTTHQQSYRVTSSHWMRRTYPLCTRECVWRWWVSWTLRTMKNDANIFAQFNSRPVNNPLVHHLYLEWNEMNVARSATIILQLICYAEISKCTSRSLAPHLWHLCASHLRTHSMTPLLSARRTWTLEGFFIRRPGDAAKIK